MSNKGQPNVERMHEYCRLVQQDKRIDLLEDFLHPDFIDHPLTGGTNNFEAAREFMATLHANVDDLEVKIINCVGDEIVATHKIFKGKVTADFRGMPKGHEMNLRVMDFMRFKDGKIIEHWALQGGLTGADS